jgi:hypothetical protein
VQLWLISNYGYRNVIVFGMSAGIAVGIAIRYGLDGPGIKSRWGARNSAPVQTSPGAHPASYKMRTGSFLEVQRPERGFNHQSHIASMYRVLALY